MRLALLAALLLASPAAAEDPPAPAAATQSPDIVVSGMRDRERQVRDFVAALTPARPDSGVSRFFDSFCPGVTGLDPGQGEKVEARLRKVAEAVGVPVGSPGCSPNALVIVTESKRALIEALALKRPYFFAELSQPEIRRLARSDGPDSAWQLEGRVNSSGVPLRADGDMIVNKTMETQSRLRPSARWVFDAAVLVVETRALTGVTATQLADYAAMRLLAKLDPSRLEGNAAPTILRLLDAPPGTALPVTLTDWDFALLRNLYSVAPNSFAASQRSEIARHMADALGGGPDQPRRQGK